MNKVILMGRLTKDPEFRYATSNTDLAVTRYSLAVDRKKSKDNEKSADFIDVVSFGKLGEFAGKFFSKGRMVSVVGHLHQNIWEDDKNQKHYRLEVIAEEQYFADNKINNSGSKNNNSEVAVTTIEDDEIPF